ncbi:MAG: aconitate hydratase AcnA [Deltaproteobacteria bacterium]|nr:aconitate hydratase AcnA [Deltaproteobacteria bacterium]
MSSEPKDSFHTLKKFKLGHQNYYYYSLPVLAESGYHKISKLPNSLKVLLENLLRHEGGDSLSRQAIESLANWDPQKEPDTEIAFRPARVLLQDFTGVPAVVDLAAMREAIQKMGGDPTKINPLQPCDLVIDHSVQVDFYGQKDALQKNTELEFQRNSERYRFLRWGQQAFRNFRVVPPGMGIVHQVNLEHLAAPAFTQVWGQACDGKTWVFPDSLVGTDSHTTMINGLGVLGWGVGGIEAEAAMLGQPISMLIPQVVGFKLTGKLPEGSTATDLVLTVTQMLRKKGVVGKFVEFYGPGLSELSLPDRATIANMAPEYGATMGFFPIDQESIRYLKLTGRDDEAKLAEKYYKEQGMFHHSKMEDPVFTDTLELDISTVVPSLAGPKRPQDRIPLDQAKPLFNQALMDVYREDDLEKSINVKYNERQFELSNGSVVIAAITSCTNTSNPSVMIAAGLLAKKAYEKGLQVKPWVKTSLAPGSKVVSEYLSKAGLLSYLENLGFNVVGYGCTTCIGNSGPLSEPIRNAIIKKDIVSAAVLSGNRNFEGRINPQVKANYLASPPLVVAYAIAGTMNIDLYHEALGEDSSGNPVYFKDIWPSQKEVAETIHEAIQENMFEDSYGEVFQGDDSWKQLDFPKGDTFTWEADSTYVKNPPYFEDMPLNPEPVKDIHGARVLALLGDSVTTDHISPAGAIPENSPAGRYLKDNGVAVKDFNSFGSRRGNHEVMMRGTFGNIRLRNLLAPGTEGGMTLLLPGEEEMPIYDAAMKYQENQVPLIILAGKEYGTGSSRDWAAKGTKLLGVQAVIAESFERIHRSNLIGMGVLPLQFLPDENSESIGLTGHETFNIIGLADNLQPRKTLKVIAKNGESEKNFNVLLRIDTPDEIEYYCHGGILQFVLRQLLSNK